MSAAAREGPDERPADARGAPLDPVLAAALATDIRAALAEDVGDGDRTGQLLDPGTRVDAQLIVREPAILCGRPWFDGVLRQVDPRLRVEWLFAEGASLESGARVCRLHGPARGLLTAERAAMNFLQLLSAVATATRRYVEAVAQVPGNRARILDTRKTLPGLRLAQKYAVRVGGGCNQRLGLYDAILIKENHIAAAGGITAAIERARAFAPHLADTLEVEVRDGAEIDEALAAGAPRLLLDNMSTAELRDAVARAAGAATLEASGGVTLANLRETALTGVDFVSIGAITHSAPSLDLSLILEAV